MWPRGNEAKQGFSLIRKIVRMKEVCDKRSHAAQKQHDASDAPLLRI